MISAIQSIVAQIPTTDVQTVLFLQTALQSISRVHRPYVSHRVAYYVYRYQVHHSIHFQWIGIVEGCHRLEGCCVTGWKVFGVAGTCP